MYDKALRDLEQLTNAKFIEFLGGLLQYYFQNVTYLEASGPGTMPLSRQEVAVNNRGRGSANDARTTDAPASPPPSLPPTVPPLPTPTPPPTPPLMPPPTPPLTQAPTTPTPP